MERRGGCARSAANEIYWQSLGKKRERKGHPVLIVRSWVKYLFDGSILSRRLSRTILWDLNKVVLAERSAEWDRGGGRQSIPY